MVVCVWEICFGKADATRKEGIEEPKPSRSLPDGKSALSVPTELGFPEIPDVSDDSASVPLRGSSSPIVYSGSLICDSCRCKSRLACSALETRLALQGNTCVIEINRCRSGGGMMQRSCLFSLPAGHLLSDGELSWYTAAPCASSIHHQPNLGVQQPSDLQQSDTAPTSEGCGKYKASRMLHHDAP